MRDRNSHGWVRRTMRSFREAGLGRPIALTLLLAVATSAGTPEKQVSAQPRTSDVTEAGSLRRPQASPVPSPNPAVAPSPFSLAPSRTRQEAGTVSRPDDVPLSWPDVPPRNVPGEPETTPGNPPLPYESGGKPLRLPAG